MKVLFLGEGKHELGSTGVTDEPHPASGFLFVLARKVCPDIGDDSIHLSWSNLSLIFKKEPRKKFDSREGLSKKVQYAIVQARRHDCAGTICVHDQDGDEARLVAMEKGRQAEIAKRDDGHRAVCALAVESIEAWLLGAPSAIAAVLQIDLNSIQKKTKEYSPSRVEELKETSEDQKKRPKKMLASIAKLKHRTANTEFREEVAGEIDANCLGELGKNCARGFKPFAEKLRAAFGPRPAS